MIGTLRLVIIDKKNKKNTVSWALQSSGIETSHAWRVNVFKHTQLIQSNKCCNNFTTANI